MRYMSITESQNVEWKESLRNKYLKLIYCFANARGEKLYINTTDDSTVISVQDSKKLRKYNIKVGCVKYSV